MATTTTDKGKNVITDRLKNGSSGTYTNAPLYVAFGGSSGGSASSNDLVLQLGGKSAGTDSLVTTSVANDTYQVVSTLTASGSWAIQESGLFTAATSGTGDMFAYSDFAVVNLAQNDSIQFTWKVQFT